MPDFSPTRISATYIGENSASCRESASAKLSPATTATRRRRRPLACDRCPDRRREGPGRHGCARPARKQQRNVARENIVTSSLRGRLNRAEKRAARRRGASARLASIGIRPRFRSSERADFGCGRRRDHPADHFARRVERADNDIVGIASPVVVTRNASATEVTPARHLATASPSMVVIPAAMAAASIVL